MHSERFQALIKAEPTLLLHHGRFLNGAMKAQRITREEILAALRANGTAEVSEVAAVVLETDGSLSIIPDSGTDRNITTLKTVDRSGEERD